MLLELKNIKKYFTVNKNLLGEAKSFVKAVDGVSLCVKEGENISLVGESGCGKTTLARIALRLMTPDTGDILFKGKNVSNFKTNDIIDYRRNMQIVFQDPYSSLDPRFSVRNIIKEAMNVDKRKYYYEKEKNKRILEVLSAVKLTEDMLYRFPNEFSGGERQRIAIARAIIMNPKLIILDEAVSSLDVIIQEQLLKLLAELQNKYNLTYMFISHNLRIVKKISKKIAVMYKGRIVEFASTDEIFNNPLHEYTKVLLSAAIDYKTISRDREIELNDNETLVNKGNDHFVLQ